MHTHVRQPDSICCIFLAFLLFFVLSLPQSAFAATFAYVPIDDRPVCLNDPVATFAAAGITVLTPPVEYLAGRGRSGNPEKVWDWLLQASDTADAVVVSADSLLYGGLVPSRTHFLPAETLAERLEKFKQLRQARPGLRIYVFSTVMRTPKMSAGGTDPQYFEKYGQQIFRLSALEDKQEQEGLTRNEARERERLTGAIPQAALADWLQRRRVNFEINDQLLRLTQEGLFQYLVLGRDDNDRYSRTQKELRDLLRSRRMPPERFATFPGADQLGMVLLTRAINDITFQIPFVAFLYAPGTGPDTIPSYQGEPVRVSAMNHVFAAGGYVTSDVARADVIIAVNTPANGVTLEADNPANSAQTGQTEKLFATMVEEQLKANRRVGIADVAFGNGADNALLEELAGRNLLKNLAAYSGWNTASNTVGFAVSQAMLEQRMPEAAKHGLLAVRLLDDWAYQANVRQEVNQAILYPRGISVVGLGESRPLVEAETGRRLQRFAADHFGGFPVPDFRASHPWDRMFEVKIELKDMEAF